jgi:hypothetical protein
VVVDCVLQQPRFFGNIMKADFFRRFSFYLPPHGLYLPELNLRPPPSQESALTPLLPTKSQATTSPSPHAHEDFKKVNIAYQQSLTPFE